MKYKYLSSIPKVFFGEVFAFYNVHNNTPFDVVTLSYTVNLTIR